MNLQKPLKHFISSSLIQFQTLHMNTIIFSAARPNSFLLGRSFGADADGVAASFLTGMDSDDDSTGNYYWDTFGGGIGN
jgi:hypothetical protein